MNGADVSSQRDQDNKQAEFADNALVHMDALYNVALKLTRNQQDAQDLVQDTFHKAYLFFHQFLPGTNCKAWLFTIMKNTFINRYRKQSKAPEIVDFNKVEPYMDLIKGPDVPDIEIDENFLEQFLGDDVNEALNQLSDDFKMVVLLSDLEGFTYDEIAVIMNCPIGTVRSRLSRGRRILQKLLIDFAQNEGYIKRVK